MKNFIKSDKNIKGFSDFKNLTLKKIVEIFNSDSDERIPKYTANDHL